MLSYIIKCVNIKTNIIELLFIKLLKYLKLRLFKYLNELKDLKFVVPF